MEKHFVFSDLILMAIHRFYCYFKLKKLALNKKLAQSQEVVVRFLNFSLYYVIVCAPLTILGC